jgi:hypothetical protein
MIIQQHRFKRLPVFLQDQSNLQDSNTLPALCIFLVLHPLLHKRSLWGTTCQKDQPLQLGKTAQVLHGTS